VQLCKEVWEKSIDAMIIGARPHLKEIIGKRLEPNILRHLLKKGADPCGEWGEYHTFVLHAPFFKGKINLDEYLIVEEERGCILKPSSWHSLYF
jgi:diphthamide synthase (EF-2-diphthine--ammonia ligase)